MAQNERSCDGPQSDIIALQELPWAPLYVGILTATPEEQ
jgi:hypothetical protein